jgi:fermentation-respiration switch protein FrsA (DUF1100 family)
VARLIGAIVDSWRRTRPKKPAGGIRRIVSSIVRILICAYVGFGALLFIFQSRFVYFPNREDAGTPGDMRLPYEDVFFTANDGVKLHGWFVPAESSRGTVLFCHGNAGNISHRLYTIHVLNQLGMDTFIFDYRGYGRSEGRPSEEGTYLDAEAGWEHLVNERRIPPERIVVFGRSLGGAVASRLARDRTPGALVLEASFTSVPDVGARMFPFLPVRWLARIDYSTLDHVREVICPTLVIHSRDDDMIPFEHGRRLFEAAREPKAFLETQGDHNDATFMSSERYLEGLGGFIAEHIERAGSAP